MKKIIITGGLGYIGMELAKLYSAKSRIYDITVIDNKFFSDRVSQLKRWNIKFKQIDILDNDNLIEYVEQADIEALTIFYFSSSKNDFSFYKKMIFCYYYCKGTFNFN